MERGYQLVDKYQKIENMLKLSSCIEFATSLVNLSYELSYRLKEKNEIVNPEDSKLLLKRFYESLLVKDFKEIEKIAYEIEGDDETNCYYLKHEFCVVDSPDYIPVSYTHLTLPTKA